MSRSYRKSWITDGYKGSKCRQFYKKNSNKVIRKTEDIPDGTSFKKVKSSYDICDYRWFESSKTINRWSIKPWRYNRK